MSGQTNKIDQNKYDTSLLGGCDSCPYHKVLGPYQMTDQGMLISCRADRSPGLTLVALNHEECSHFKVDSRL